MLPASTKNVIAAALDQPALAAAGRWRLLLVMHVTAALSKMAHTLDRLRVIPRTHILEGPPDPERGNMRTRQCMHELATQPLA